jgi:hypothetical protein
VLAGSLSKSHVPFERKRSLTWCFSYAIARLQSAYRNKLLSAADVKMCNTGCDVPELTRAISWNEDRLMPLIGYLQLQMHLASVAPDQLHFLLAHQLAEDLNLDYTKVCMVMLPHPKAVLVVIAGQPAQVWGSHSHGLGRRQAVLTGHHETSSAMLA